MTPLNEIVGQEIRALRQKRRCTLAHLALATDMSRSYLSEVERGGANISLTMLERIAAAFEVSPLVLLGVDADEQGRRTRAEERLRQIAALATAQEG